MSIAEDFLPLTNKGLVGLRGVALEFSLSGELEGGKEGHRGGKLEPADVTQCRFVFPVCQRKL